MMDKKMLFLLLLLAGGIYFFRKKAIDSLIIICFFAIYMLTNNNSEHLTSAQDESIQNIASMYNNKVLTASNLNITGTLTVGGTSILTGAVTTPGGINNTGSLTVNGTSKFTGDVTTQKLTADGVLSANQNINAGADINVGIGADIITHGDLYIDQGKSLILGGTGSGAGAGLTFDMGGNGTFYDRATGNAYYRGFDGIWYLGNWNVYKSGGITKPT